MTASDLSTAYIDTRDLEPRKDACPFRGCAARLETAPYRRKLLPYCPIHAIRIHANGFVYYYGSDTSSKRKAAMRNIRFERDFFARCAATRGSRRLHAVQIGKLLGGVWHLMRPAP